MLLRETQTTLFQFCNNKFDLMKKILISFENCAFQILKCHWDTHRDIGTYAHIGTWLEAGVQTLVMSDVRFTNGT